jgi:hypothetical protein
MLYRFLGLTILVRRSVYGRYSPIGQEVVKPNVSRPYLDQCRTLDLTKASVYP